MTLLAILSITNTVFLIAAHLNTWLPITFRVFRRVQMNYTALIAGFIGVAFVWRYVKRYGYPPDEGQVHKAIYGVFPLSIVLQYRMNWLSAFLYQIILWLLILLFGS